MRGKSLLAIISLVFVAFAIIVQAPVVSYDLLVVLLPGIGVILLLLILANEKTSIKKIAPNWIYSVGSVLFVVATILALIAFSALIDELIYGPFTFFECSFIILISFILIFNVMALLNFWRRNINEMLKMLCNLNNLFIILTGITAATATGRVLDDMLSVWYILFLPISIPNIFSIFIVNNYAESTEVQTNSITIPPTEFTPHPNTPANQFTTLRTIWDPSDKDFVWGAGKPDEYGELPRIKRWIEGNNPNIYWFLLKIVNHADHPVTEWNVTLYTEQALTITETHIDEKQVRIVKSDFDTDNNRNVCVVAIPPELGVSIPANGGKRSMYFKMDIRCEDALKMEFGVSGVVKLGKSPQIEDPIREKRFIYACKYGDFRNMYYGSIDALASMAITNLQDSYSREIVQNFTNSFRLIRDFEKYCNDRYAESEILIEKLEVVHSSLKAAEPITKDEILPLVEKNLNALQIMNSVEEQKERGIRMCEKLVELLHIAISNIRYNNIDIEG